MRAHISGVYGALLGAVLFAGCGAAPEALKVTLTGAVFETAPDHYEQALQGATGSAVIVTAVLSGGADKDMRTTDDVTWNVSPDDGGTFQKGDAGMEFSAKGPGTYEIWAAASPKIVSPRVTLVVPPPDRMRASPAAAAAPAAEHEAPIRVKIGPDGTEVGVDVGPVDVEITTPNEPAPAPRRGKRK